MIEGFLCEGETFLKESFLPRAPSSKNFQTGVIFIFYIVRLTVVSALLTRLSMINKNHLH